MRLTKEIFTAGLVLTGKTQHPTRFQTAEERSAGVAPERVRVDDEFGEPGTGPLAVDVLALMDSTSFGGEAEDVPVAVRVPEPALKGIDISRLRFQQVAFKGLEVDVNVNRRTGQLRVLLSAEGLDVRGGKPAGGEQA